MELAHVFQTLPLLVERSFPFTGTCLEAMTRIEVENSDLGSFLPEATQPLTSIELRMKTPAEGQSCTGFAKAVITVTA